MTLKTNKTELYFLGRHPNLCVNYQMISRRMLENYKESSNLTALEALTIKLLISMGPCSKDLYDAAILKHSRLLKIHQSLQTALNISIPQFGLEMTKIMLYAQTAKTMAVSRIRDYGNRVYQLGYLKICSHEADSEECDFYSWLIYQ